LDVEGRMPIKKYAVLVCAVSLALLTACATGIPKLSSSDHAGIYAAVVRQLATKDDTFGGNLKPPKVFIVKNTSWVAAAPTMTVASNNSFIPEGEQREITAALGSLNATIVWVDKLEDAVTTGNTSDVKARVKDGGAVISLGSIRAMDDGSVQVTGQIYLGFSAMGGRTYILTKSEGVWNISGTTGPAWIT
jgi:hypothetical protein